MTLARRLVSEGLGTALLLAIVVGSGIMGERLSAGNVAIALLANALATGAGLFALIVVFGPASGAHFNPLVTLASAARGQFGWREVPAYCCVQFAGALLGVAIVHLMFGEKLFAASQHIRTGGAQWWSEFVASFGLLAVIFGCQRARTETTAAVVGTYIFAAYWFTASTSFANPAVTLARATTDTFAGIRPIDVGAFIVAQLLGAAVATGLFAWLLPTSASNNQIR